MYAFARPFVNAQKSVAVARLAGCVLAGGMATACVGNPFSDVHVDPRSPIAGEVVKTARLNTDYPTFSEIPPVPKDIRPARLYGVQAAAADREREALERATAPDTWTLQATETFAGQVRQAAGPEAPVTPMQSEAFAQELRKRATPPPPPKR